MLIIWACRHPPMLPPSSRGGRGGVPSGCSLLRFAWPYGRGFAASYHPSRTRQAQYSPKCSKTQHTLAKYTNILPEPKRTATSTNRTTATALPRMERTNQRRFAQRHRTTIPTSCLTLLGDSQNHHIQKRSRHIRLRHRRRVSGYSISHYVPRNTLYLS